MSPWPDKTASTPCRSSLVSPTRGGVPPLTRTAASCVPSTKLHQHVATDAGRPLPPRRPEGDRRGGLARRERGSLRQAVSVADASTTARATALKGLDMVGA